MEQYRKNEVLTILTDPIPSLYQYYKEKIKAAVRPWLRKIDGKKPLKKIKYGGHFAVTRSLVEGLQRSGIPFVYNPQRVKDCTDKVVVLANIPTLQQAIALKNKGKIKKLAAGPNLVIMPSDDPDVIGSKQIDTFIVNSQWIKDAYCLEMPQLLSHTVIWPAGVDAFNWKPSTTEKKKNTILFYAKRPEWNLYAACKILAEQKGLAVTEIIYGEYNEAGYRELLESHCWLVHFVEQESQGISLLEAWSMDVPTLVWNPGTYHLKGLNVVSSSAPYLSGDTGMFFNDTAGFEYCIGQLLSGTAHFAPRNWVLNNMTDEIAARHLTELLK